jgi:hypothetical protein
MADSNYLALHNQDLVDVMVEADNSSSPSALILHDLAEGGHAYALNEKLLGPLRREGKAFKRNIWASPILTDLMSPLNAPDINQVKEILLNDIHAGRGLLTFSPPPRGSPDEDALVMSNLINNLDNPRYRQPGFVSILYSPELDHIYRYTPDWHQDGILNVSQVIIDVTSADNVLDMEFCDSYTHSTLVTGSKIWLVFRPTSNNMARLQAHRDTENHALGPALNHARNYDTGIILIQRPGQTLILPPFWIATAISSQPTVSATFRIATATEFHERIKQLGKFRLTIRLHAQDANVAQQVLFTFADELIEHLRAILENNFPECNLNKLISDICRDHQTFRAGLRSVLEAIEDKAVVKGLEDKWRAAWINFLEMKRKKTHKPFCRLCNLHIRDMPAGDSPKARLREHFIEFHCLHNTRSIKRIPRK